MGRLDTILCLLVIAADIRHFHMEFTLAYLQSALQQQHFEKEAMYTYIRWYVLLKGTSTCSTVLTFPQKADADSEGSHGICIRTAHKCKDDYVNLSWKPRSCCTSWTIGLSFLVPSN